MYFLHSYLHNYYSLQDITVKLNLRCYFPLPFDSFEVRKSPSQFQLPSLTSSLPLPTVPQWSTPTGTPFNEKRSPMRMIKSQSFPLQEPQQEWQFTDKYEEPSTKYASVSAGSLEQLARPLSQRGDKSLLIWVISSPIIRQRSGVKRSWFNTEGVMQSTKFGNACLEDFENEDVYVPYNSSWIHEARSLYEFLNGDYSDKHPNYNEKKSSWYPNRHVAIMFCLGEPFRSNTNREVCNQKNLLFFCLFVLKSGSNR